RSDTHRTAIAPAVRSGMLHFHSYWTRPLFEAGENPASRHIEVWEYEALTWLLSALQIRRHSPLRLITDSRGLEVVRNTRLDWLYTGGISTALDEIPNTVDPNLFWAAGKIFAWQAVDEPAVSVDTDAVLWSPINVSAPAMALHIEDTQWPWYECNRAEF